VEPILERGAKNKWIVESDTPTDSAPTPPKSVGSAQSPRSPTSPTPTTEMLPPKDRDRRTREVKSKDDLSNKVEGIRINNSEKSQRFAGAIGYNEPKGRGHWGHDDRFSNNDYEAPRPRPDRPKGKKCSESPEKPEWNDRPERTKVPEGNWRAQTKDSKEKVAQTPSKIALPPCDEVWD